MARIILVTGGARSGKSGYAEKQALSLSGARLYVATCPHGEDAELAARITRHQQDRTGKGWQTIEESCDLAGVLARQSEKLILVDCLTLWLSNIMCAEGGEKCDEDAIASRCRELIEVSRTRKGTVIYVTNEVGSGIVPDNPLARRFRDLAGRMNQTMAAAADRVVLVACGLPLVLKDEETRQEGK